MDMLGQKLLN